MYYMLYAIFYRCMQDLKDKGEEPRRHPKFVVSLGPVAVLDLSPGCQVPSAPSTS